MSSWPRSPPGYTCSTSSIPGGFLPEEDQGYLFSVLQLPDASSLQRSSEAARDVEAGNPGTPGVKSCTSVIGFSLLSFVQEHLQQFLLHHPEAVVRQGSREGPGHPGTPEPELKQTAAGHGGSPFRRPPYRASAPPAALRSSWRTAPARTSSSWRTIPRSSLTRPGNVLRLRGVSTTILPNVPQYFVDVDRDKVLKPGRGPGARFTARSRLSWAGSSSITSTASAGSGRCTSRPRADYRTNARAVGPVLRAQRKRRQPCRSRR